jgi:Transposase, Mutator family
LGWGVRRAGQPRHQRCADRLLRRAHRLPRSDRGNLAEFDDPNLCGAPDPGCHAVRQLEGPLSRPAALKPIYHAADADAARIELEAFKASELGRNNPHTVATFENAWERFTPFLAFPPMLRVPVGFVACQCATKTW